MEPDGSLSIPDGSLFPGSPCPRFVRTERLESEARWGWPIEQRIGDYHGWLGLLALALDYCKVVFGLCSELGRGGTANTSIVAASGRIMALHEVFIRPFPVF